MNAICGGDGGSPAAFQERAISGDATLTAAGVLTLISHALTTLAGFDWSAILPTSDPGGGKRRRDGGRDPPAPDAPFQMSRAGRHGLGQIDNDALRGHGPGDRRVPAGARAAGGDGPRDSHRV